MTTYTLEAGRTIYRDGKPFIAIMRCGLTQPWEADDECRKIAALIYRTGYDGAIKPPEIGYTKAIELIVAAARRSVGGDSQACRRLNRALEILGVKPCAPTRKRTANRASCDQ